MRKQVLCIKLINKEYFRLLENEKVAQRNGKKMKKEELNSSFALQIRLTHGSGLSRFYL
jgi:hypothetical protein